MYKPCTYVHLFRYERECLCVRSYVCIYVYMYRQCVCVICVGTTSSAVYRILCVIYTACVMFVACMCVHCDFTTYVYTCVWVYTRYVLPVCIDTCKRVCEVTIRTVCCYVCVHACILCTCVETTHSHARL